MLARGGAVNWKWGQTCRLRHDDEVVRGQINMGGRTRGRVKRLGSAQGIDANGRDVTGLSYRTFCRFEVRF